MIGLIVARSKNNVIGKNGNIPWEIKGEQKQFRELTTGNVVIMGDVNHGAEIIAYGNIVVMGALRGVAHAGANGNDEAFVSAFRLQATQLRIGKFIARAPDNSSYNPKYPEVAFIRDEMIQIEPYITKNR